MNITFREYREKDKDLLVEFANKLEEHVKSLDPIKRIKNSPGFIEASTSETLKNAKTHDSKIWFVEDEKKVIGYIVGIIWNQSDLNKLEIGVHKLGQVIDLYLDKEYRGKGIGKTMLFKMEDFFKEKGCDSVWIKVFAANENARNTYKKYGFIDREIGMLKEI